jgi:hypothetical protein
MFLVEYQKDGRTLREVPMLGANLADVLSGAQEDVSGVEAEEGVRPDMIRISDVLNNRVTLHDVPPDVERPQGQKCKGT